MSILVDWNGIDIPDELRELPTGRYVLVAVDDAPELTAGQEAGLEAALASIRAGRGVPVTEARQRVTARLER